MSRYSSETADEAREAIRRLSSDIAVFRAPAVQDHLRAPSNASTPPALQAQIIALRTQLHDANESSSIAKDDLLSARKRAACAEAKVRELEEDLKRDQVRHAEMQLKAAERMEKLEREMKKKEESAEERALRLRDTMERDRLGYSALVAQKDEFEGLSKRLREKAQAGEREMEVTKKKWEVEKRGLEGDRDRIARRATGLEDELEYLKEGLKRGNVEKKDSALEGEVKRLREVIVDLERDEGKARTELELMRGKVDALESEIEHEKEGTGRLMALEAEIGILRKQKKEFLTMKQHTQHTQALIKEREGIVSLVRGLSEHGDVQEGLRILKEAAGGKGLRVKKGTGASVGTTDVEQQYKRKVKELEQIWKETEMRLQGEIRKIAQELVDANTLLSKTIAEKDDALALCKRNQRIQKILELEKYFLKQRENIEMDFDKPADPDGLLKRLRERCDVYEKCCVEYKDTIKRLEQSLHAREREIVQLRAKPAATAAEKEIGDESIRKLKTQLSVVEGKLRNLQKAYEASVAGRTQLDYNPSGVKVVHLKDNPLTKASQAAQAELDKMKGKKRLREALGDNTSPPRDSHASARVEELERIVQGLHAKNADLTKSSKVGIRTGEIAKKKIEEVRAAVYNLFGWSMKVTGAKYTIASIYAEGPEEYLEFGINETQTMTLHETEYATRLVDEIETYVHKMKSFPALLANITMDNFDKTTVFC